MCVTAHSPADLQVLLDVAGIYSKSEHYSLQPTKCVVVPFRHPESSCNWSILGQPIPLEESTRHIGVQRTSSNNSAGATVKANITKARGALYSLMSSGLHGKRGLNPCTSIKLWQIYVLPILTYGLELFTLNQTLNTELENFQTRTFRQLLSLPDSTPSSAVLILTGLIPVEALVHKKVLSRIASLYPSLKYLNSEDYRVDKPHVALMTVAPSVMNVRRLPTKLRLMTGRYMLQSNCAPQNQHHSGTCSFCQQDIETRQHFLTSCQSLNDTRAKAPKALAQVALLYSIHLDCLDPEELTLLIINCKLYILKVIDTPRTRDLTELESATRRLCYDLHCARRRYLSVGVSAVQP